MTEVREPARTARRDATRERVLDAAREVFAERGVIGATVEEICDRAGFTRGAFYSNFADKADLLGALIAREHGRLLAMLDENFSAMGAAVAAAQADPAGLLAPLVDRILASVPGDRLMSLVQTELEIHAIREPAGSRPFRDAQDRFRARIVDFLVTGMRLLGRELTVEPACAAEAAIGIVERSARLALIEGGDDPDAMARAVLPGFLLGVSRPVSG